MYKELEYKKIASISVIVLIFDVFINFRDPFAQAVADFIFDLIAINTIIFLTLWLRNFVLLIGYFLFIILFNIKLQFNPLFFESDSSLKFVNPTSLNYLSLISYGIVLVGLFTDKYFHTNLKLTVKPILLVTFVGTVIFQILMCYYR